MFNYRLLSSFGNLSNLGYFFLLIGLLLILLPEIVKRFNLFALENIPWFIIYIYKTNNFTFITSPLLIILSLFALVIYCLTWNTHRWRVESVK